MAYMRFYRVHYTEASGEFSADNAWSSQMSGTVREGDVGQEQCQCRLFGDPADPDCPDCYGEGWADRDRGYSCCYSAEDLIAYWKNGGTGWLDDMPVVIFEGHRTGTCPDGEPLAVPDAVIAWTTSGQLAMEAGE